MTPHRTMDRVMDRTVWLWLAAGLLVYLALCLKPGLAFIDDMAMIQAVGGDEHGVMEALWGMLQNNSADPRFYKYGGLYFQAPWIGLELLRVETVHGAALTMRLVSWLGGAAVILCLVWASAQLFGRTAALATTILACLLPLLVRWGAFIHPDTWALAGTTAAMGLSLVGLDQRRWSLFLWAGLIGGAGAGLKLSGAFVGPFVVAAACLAAWRGADRPWSNSGPTVILVAAVMAGAGLGALAMGWLATPDRLAKAAELIVAETGSAASIPGWLPNLPSYGRSAAWLLFGGVGCFLILIKFGLFRKNPRITTAFSLSAAVTLLFGLGLVAVNNAILFKPNQVAAFVLTESVRLGHGWQRPDLFWIQLPAGTGFWGGVALVASMGGLIWGLVKPDQPGRRAIYLLLGLWLVGLLAYLSDRVSAPFPRHGINLLPALVWLAAALTGKISQAVVRAGGGAIKGTALALIATGCLPAVGFIGHDLSYSTAVENKAASPSLALGVWLKETYPPRTRIDYDPYVYVPDQFFDRRQTWTPTAADLDRRRPDLIITNKSFYRRFFSEHHQAGRFLPRRRERAREYYAALEKDGWGGRYRVVRRTNGLTVYKRAD